MPRKKVVREKNLLSSSEDEVAEVEDELDVSKGAKRTGASGILNP